MRGKYTKEQLQKAVSNSLSIRQTLESLGIVPAGGNYKTFHQKVKEWEIDISHFTGKAWNQGKRYRMLVPPKPLEEYLVEGSRIASYKLKNKLYKAGLKEKQCECCGITEWQGKEISFELDHINGVNDDNRLENLQILCPNCHSQTPTWRGKNRNKRVAQKETSDVESLKFREGYQSDAIANPEPSYQMMEGVETKKGKPKLRKPKQLKTCKNCGSNFINGRKDQKFCSVSCYRESHSSNIPTAGQLIDDFKQLNSFLAVGRKYNVSDNSVRKWCLKYGIFDMVKR